MDPNGAVQTQAPPPPPPGDLILAKKNAAQEAAQTSGDGSLYSQLTNNPFFTAVSTSN